MNNKKTVLLLIGIIIYFAVPAIALSEQLPSYDAAFTSIITRNKASSITGLSYIPPTSPAASVLRFMDFSSAIISSATESPSAPTNDIFDLDEAITSSSLSSVGLTVTVQSFGSVGSGGSDINAASERLVSTPEPATLLLLGTGLVGVAGAARRRRKKM